MTRKPNILVLFTDMQRADTIHALGNETIKTPSLDRLAEEGTAFTNCFSPSPVCVPARYCMHYGVYPQVSGLYDNGIMPADNGNSYVGLLSKAEYTTQAVGKCHFTPDNQALRGYKARLTQEEMISDPASDDYCRFLADNGYDYMEPQGVRSEMYYIPQVSHLPEKAHSSAWIGDRSVSFIDEHKHDNQPWHLYASFIHPHPPLAVPKPWHKLYRGPDMDYPNVPDNPEELCTWVNRYQNRYKYRDQGIDKQLVRMMKAYYYAAISFVDYQIGKILECLEDTEQIDNTFIMFTSDHGEYLGDYDCFGKRAMHDAASRVPMIVRYPDRFKKGDVCDIPTNLVDVFPTVCAAAGIDTDGIEIDGVNLQTIAEGDAERKVVYSQFGSGPRGIYMAVSKEHKYIYSAADQKEYFFDRMNDPAETRNAADDQLLVVKKHKLKQNLLFFLKGKGVEDAYVEENALLDWKQYPYVKAVSDDPDKGLLFQDAPGSVADIAGYS